MRERAKFLAAFVRRPFQTGAITPSSAYLAEAMVEGMGIAEADTVVELGPGTGVFTGVIEKQLRPDAQFLSLEINPALANRLRGRFPRVVVVSDSVENIRRHLDAVGRQEVCATISGLPWASFSPEQQRRLLDATVDAIKPGGRFATFAYSHAAWLPPGRRFRELLNSRFRKVETSKVVWRNAPPAFVYRCLK